MRILGKLEKSMDCWFLIIISLVFFFLRFPSLFEPNWYGDEGVYQTLGIGMNAGRLLYRDIFDNKPPLLYFLYSLVSSDQFMIRFVSLIVGLLTVIAFFYLSKKLFSAVAQSQKASYISTILFSIFFGLPLIEGNIANAENFMLLPNIIAGFLVLKSIDPKSKKIRYKLQLLAGFIVGISFLLKVVAVFDFSAFFVFLFFANYPGKLIEILKPENFIKEIKNLLPLILGFVVPIILVTAFFIFKNAFPDFIRATLFSNIGYVGYGNKFIIPQGFLILKLLLLSVFSLFIFSKRKILGNNFSLVALWLAFSLFDAYFSQRPYTHYVLVLLPSLCLMTGFFITNKNYSRIAGVITIASVIAVLLSFSFYRNTIFYYQNFVSFIVGQKNLHDYRKFFDSSTPRDYALTDYIILNTKAADNIFIWGNNAQVYKLTNKLPPGKYTVAYHITSYKDGLIDTETGLKSNNPKFVIVMPNASGYPFSLSKYYLKINMDGTQIYEKLF
jgi:hypothetical protein